MRATPGEKSLLLSEQHVPATSTLGQEPSGRVMTGRPDARTKAAGPQRTWLCIAITWDPQHLPHKPHLQDGAQQPASPSESSSWAVNQPWSQYPVKGTWGSLHFSPQRTFPGKHQNSLSPPFSVFSPRAKGPDTWLSSCTCWVQCTSDRRHKPCRCKALVAAGGPGAETGRVSSQPRNEHRF